MPRDLDNCKLLWMKVTGKCINVKVNIELSLSGPARGGAEGLRRAGPPAGGTTGGAREAGEAG